MLCSGVGRGDEHDVRQVVGNLEVVVEEGGVLLGVEHLQQRRGRVPAPVASSSCRSRPAGTRGCACRPSAWPGAPCPGAPRRRSCGARGSPPRRAPRPGDTRTKLRPRARATDLPREVLPVPGGPMKQRMGPLTLPLSWRTAMKSRMRSFDLLQVVVVLVEDVAGVLDVPVVLGGLAPGQVGDPLEVGAQHRGLGRHGLHARRGASAPARTCSAPRRAGPGPSASPPAPARPWGPRPRRRAPAGSPSSAR